MVGEAVAAQRLPRRLLLRVARGSHPQADGEVQEEPLDDRPERDALERQLEQILEMLARADLSGPPDLRLVRRPAPRAPRAARLAVRGAPASHPSGPLRPGQHALTALRGREGCRRRVHA